MVLTLARCGRPPALVPAARLDRARLVVKTAGHAQQLDVAGVAARLQDEMHLRVVLPVGSLGDQRPSCYWIT